MMGADIPPVSAAHLRRATLVFGGAGLVLLVPLLFVFPGPAFAAAARALVIAAALFWGVLSVAVVLGFWSFYYAYFYPTWVRRLVPLDVLLYGGLGLGLWWLAWHLPAAPVLWFVLLGGLEGIVEHVFGIYALRILDKVPWLRGVAARPVVVFSFGEYVLYWSLVAWLALALSRVVGL